MFNLIKQFHQDEDGAEGLEKLLLLAALILPLLGLLVWYGGDLKEWLMGKWETMKGDTTLDP